MRMIDAEGIRIKPEFMHDVCGMAMIRVEDIVRIINEQPTIKPKRGKWIKKHRHYGGFRSYTGFDAMGEQHTVTVDERTEYDDLYCSECGARSADNFLNFCPRCGSYNGGEINDQ